MPDTSRLRKRSGIPSARPVDEAPARDQVRAGSQEPEEPPAASDPVDPSLGRPRRHRRLRGLLKKLLEAIDIVLDSIVGALAGVGEALKEFKQALVFRCSVVCMKKGPPAIS